MQHYPETTWETLSEEYRLSPFFNLDRAVASFAERQGANQSTNIDAIDVSTSNDDTIENATFQDLARPKTFNSSLKAAAVACRELTGLIVNCTHLCQNINALDHLSNMLEEARAYISGNIYTDGNLALEIDTSSRKRKARQQQGSSRKKKPKSSLKISKTTSKTKRVGVAAEKRKQPIRVQRQNQNEYNQTIVIDGHTSLPSEDSISIQPPTAESTSDKSHPPEHVKFRDPICAVVGEGETVINASHPPKHVEFRDPICTVMGEEDIVIKNDTRSGITLNVEGYQINQNSLDDLDSELPDEDRNVGFLTTASITSIFCDLIDPLDPFPTHNYLDKFDVHVKHKLKEVIEMTELQGNARRLGFTHRHYLTVKDSINNSKLQATLDKMMSQNMNSGTRYFKDVLFVEAEILVVSHIKKIIVPEADRLLHPLPSLKR
ncbi:unnamed protein product [Mytilus coruscus]|uniref:Uncharacterized protein n=1 Tax=Mytilus coruscus TaxID=42192 RepID=A0A6J8DM19_MYTCO|nr:unnamed protein product [Mytilus coruscus]